MSIEQNIDGSGDVFAVDLVRLDLEPSVVGVDGDLGGVCMMGSTQKKQASVRSPRTQEERRRTTRLLLIDAAIQAIDEEGYARASVSRIVERAGVSRGGHLHHFASKDLIFAAVGAHLSASVFRKSGAVLAACPSPDQRLAALLRFLWRDVLSRRDGRVLLELMVASRTDAQLAERLRPLALKTMRLYGRAAERLFVARPGAEMSVQTAFRLAQWSLRGMMTDRPLAQDKGFFDREVEALIALINHSIAGRPQ